MLDRIEAVQDGLKKAERALSEANKKLALGGGGGAEAAPAAETVNGVNFGVITGQSNPPRNLQLAAKFLF